MGVVATADRSSECSVSYAWDETLKAYDFGRGHPLSPIRTMLAYRLTEACGVTARPNLRIVDGFKPVSDRLLARVHTPEYIDAVRSVSGPDRQGRLEFGLGTEDVPVFEGMHDAAARVCAASVAVARDVLKGRVSHGLNICGGLHHAMPATASGFCVYNDIGVAIAELLEAGVERVAYVDVDVHHGDGVQAMFDSDPRVMTISIHESGRTLFPGTGRPTEIGSGRGRGTVINVALPAGTGDNSWLRAFDAVVPDALRVFRPQVLVTQHGCDSHRFDPLAHLRLSIEGQRESYLRLHDLAHELCDGRWVATGGGGYDWISVVPRAWTHLAAIATGYPLDPTMRTPDSFMRLVKEIFETDAPATLGDGAEIDPRSWAEGFDPLDPVDKAVLRTRDAVYPDLGLMTY